MSPPLPPRLHASLPDSAPGSRLSSSLSDAPAGPPPHPSPQFPGLDPSNLAALSAGYPRLGGGMMGLGAAMPTLPYSSSDQNPYSSISMENFYSPLVSLNNNPVSKQHMHLPANFFSNIIKYLIFFILFSHSFCRPTPIRVLKRVQLQTCPPGPVVREQVSLPRLVTILTTPPPWLPMVMVEPMVWLEPGRM